VIVVSAPNARAPTSATRSANAPPSSASNSSASGSGADHTIEIRRPGRGSHASTPPSDKNHWNARPRLASSLAKLATIAV
jgi:hypothetical protein